MIFLINGYFLDPGIPGIRAMGLGVSKGSLGNPQRRKFFQRKFLTVRGRGPEKSTKNVAQNRCFFGGENAVLGGLSGNGRKPLTKILQA